MQRVGIKALKNNLSQYVRAAAAGERVLVIDREKVVAELRPPPADPVAIWNSRREAAGQRPLTPFEEEGVREGWLQPASQFGPLPDMPPPEGEPEVPFTQLMEDLSRDREDR